MYDTASLKKEFLLTRDKLSDVFLQDADAFQFSLDFSNLVEDIIRRVCANKKYEFALVAAGSFSRRELSPYSDIDIMFIVDNTTINETDISSLITVLWDCGIEVSHTIRDFSDIQKYLHTDLKTFTQLFETRFLLGNDSIYSKWNEAIFEALDKPSQIKILNGLYEDVQNRNEKYGDSPKVLEPNVKLSAGGLRDFHTVEWMFIVKNKILLNKQNEYNQAQVFIEMLAEYNYTSRAECTRLFESFRLVLTVRNLLHLLNKQKYDRFEFQMQPRIAELLSSKKERFEVFMKYYFQAANVLNRFLKSMMKKFQEELSAPLPDSLAIILDDDYKLIGKEIFLIRPKNLSLSDIFRGFYYRGLYSGHFNEHLRSLVVEKVENFNLFKYNESESSVFFREILKLQKNVGTTLMVMNELGVIGAFLPEFQELNGFFQPGVYHCYTVDEHTIISIQNAEKLDKDASQLGKVYRSIENKEILFLALLFHDIGKPIDISGHEILGAEITSSIMTRLGYSDDEIEKVTFLVKHHLIMEQIAFRRNLNDAETLNSFALKFPSIELLNMLYILTYGDLSAVNSAVWTSWKNDLLSELYLKAKAMIEEQVSGEQLLMSSVLSVSIDSEEIQDHIEAMNDISYSYHFTEDEIKKHINEITKSETVSVFFKDLNDFTNITVITKDHPALLSKICGVFAINDINIYDARIFTRKDSIVIDTFNVANFRNHQKIDPEKYGKIKKDLNKVLLGTLKLQVEFANLKSRWKRLESKIFNRVGKVKVVFDKHEKYTIIEIHSPDRLGFLYKVTSKISDLGLIIYFAKISTKGDDIVDSFYVLTTSGKKVSVNDYEFIRSELINSISQIL